MLTWLLLWCFLYGWPGLFGFLIVDLEGVVMSYLYWVGGGFIFFLIVFFFSAFTILRDDIDR